MNMEEDITVGIETEDKTGHHNQVFTYYKNWCHHFNKDATPDQFEVFLSNWDQIQPTAFSQVHEYFDNTEDEMNAKPSAVTEKPSRKVRNEDAETLGKSKYSGI
eukprot:scaffold8536_cov36-Cyclotella_meneghiniana.AAC.3